MQCVRVNLHQKHFSFQQFLYFQQHSASFYTFFGIRYYSQLYRTWKQPLPCDYGRCFFVKRGVERCTRHTVRTGRELQLITVFQMLFISCWNFRLCQPCGNLPQVPFSCWNKEQECLESFLPLQRLLTDFKLHSTVSVQHRIHTDKGSLKAEVSSMLYWQPTNCHLDKKYIA